MFTALWRWWRLHLPPPLEMKPDTAPTRNESEEDETVHLDDEERTAAARELEHARSANEYAMRTLAMLQLEEKVIVLTVARGAHGKDAGEHDR